MPYTPTVAIGLGAAGIRMVEAIDEVFDEEGVDGKFMPVAIDTKQDELDDFLPGYESKYKLNMRQPDDYEEGAAPRTYLDDDDSLAVEGGAQKERPVARYYLDSHNFTRANSRLRNRLQEFLDDIRHDNVDIWLISSLGGGTGSGLLPGVASLLEFIVDHELNTTVGFRIRGVGSFPSIGEFDHTAFGGDARHVLNSYVAMREIQGLVGGKNGTLADPDVEFESNPSRLMDNELHPENPLDSYYLLPYDEERDSTGYRREMNRVVAYFVYYYALVEASEDFPQNIPPYQQDDVYMIDARELTFPREAVRDYLERVDRRDATEETIADLETQLAGFREDEAYINEVIALPSGSTPDPDSVVNPYWIENALQSNDEGTGVQDFAVDRITEQTLQTRAEDTAEYVVSEAEETLQNRFTLDDADEETLREVLDDESDDESLYDALEGFAAQAVVEYLYYDQLHARLVPEMNTAKEAFVDALKDAWNEYRDDFQDRYPSEFRRAANADDPKSRWEDGLRPYFHEERRRLKREIDDSLLFSGDLEDELDAKNEARKSVGSEFQRLEELEDKVNLVRQARDRADARLNDYRNDLERAIRLTERGVDQRESELEAHERRLEEAAADLQNFSRRRFSDLSLDSVDTLTQATLDELADAVIGDLIPQYVAEDDLRQELNDLVLALKNVSDYDRHLEGEDEPASVLAYMLSEENVADGTVGWDGLLRELGNDAPFDRVADADKRVDIADDLTVRLLGLHTNIQFEHIPWWSDIRAASESDEEYVSELLGSTETRNEALEAHFRFAYPELVPEAPIEAESPPADD